MKRQWLILASISVLSACGGVGDFGPKGASGESTAVGTSTGPALRFSPGKVTATYEAGTSTTLSVKASINNPRDFIGASAVYVDIVDEKGVITTNVNITQTSDGEYTARFHTSSSLPPGRYQGDLLLKLCRDLTCTSQFPGSPSLLPYDVEVLPANGKEQRGTGGTVARVAFASTPDRVV
jgi:hypothetical protein